MRLCAAAGWNYNLVHAISVFKKDWEHGYLHTYLGRMILSHFIVDVLKSVGSPTTSQGCSLFPPFLILYHLSLVF